MWGEGVGSSRGGGGEGGAPRGAAGQRVGGVGGRVPRADGEGDHLDWIVDIPQEERVGKGQCGKKKGGGRWGRAVGGGRWVTQIST